MMFGVLFSVEVAKGKTRSDVMTAIGFLPFVPTKGLMMVAVEGDDFREVEQVFYKASDAQPVQVFFVAEEHRKVAWMRGLGWKSDSETGGGR